MKNFAITAAILLLPAAAGAVTYIVDDGTPSGAGFGIGANGLILNQFLAVSGGESVTSLEIAFTSGSPASTVFEIILFSDPNNDGNPTDGIELARATATTPGTIVPGQFVTFSFALPVTVTAGQNFFAGVVEEQGEDKNLLINTDTGGGNASWAVFPGEDPSTASNVGVVSSFGGTYAKDFMIRAVAVPEPSAAALAGLAAALLCLRRKRA